MVHKKWEIIMTLNKNPFLDDYAFCVHNIFVYECPCSDCQVKYEEFREKEMREEKASRLHEDFYWYFEVPHA